MVKQAFDGGEGLARAGREYQNSTAGFFPIRAEGMGEDLKCFVLMLKGLPDR
jgi:hypothetical protein